MNAATALAARACPLCGSTDEARVLAEANLVPEKLDRYAFASRKMPEFMHHRLVLCPRCDLLYASPIPDPEVLAAAYRGAAFDSGDEAHYASRTYGTFLPALAVRLADQQGALDIGTGDGAFLEQLLAAGFKGVVGIEPSPEAIAAARASIRPLVVPGVFKSGVFPERSYSLVTCFQTIEHVSDPLEMCSEAYKLLKRNGALFLIGHNRRALANRLLGRKSPIYDLEHLQLFSPQSARFLLERAGFSGIELRALTNCYPLHYWLKLLPLPNALKRPIVGLLRGRAIGRLPIALPVGNMAIVGYRRE